MISEARRYLCFPHSRYEQATMNSCETNNDGNEQRRLLHARNEQRPTEFSRSFGLLKSRGRLKPINVGFRLLHTSPTSGHEHAKWSRPRDQGEKEVDTTCIEETQLYLSPKPLLLVIENQTSHGIKMNKGKTYVLSKLLSTKIVKHQTNRIQISPKATNLM